MHVATHYYKRDPKSSHEPLAELIAWSEDMPAIRWSDEYAAVLSCSPCRRDRAWKRRQAWRI